MIQFRKGEIDLAIAERRLSIRTPRGWFIATLASGHRRTKDIADGHWYIRLYGGKGTSGVITSKDNNAAGIKFRIKKAEALTS